MQNNNFKRSSVADEDGVDMVNAERSSLSLPLGRGQDEVVKAVEGRVCQALDISPTQVEQQQIVFYPKGASFGLHHDSGTVINESDDDDSLATITVNVNQPVRSTTIFVYLNSLPVGQGGETSFPFLNLNVTPRAGDAIMFSNLLPDGTADVNTCHQALSVDGDLIKLGLVRVVKGYIYLFCGSLCMYVCMYSTHIA
jgi:prolyl 4-hydroxylase